MNILRKIYSKMMEDNTNSITTRQKYYIWLLSIISLVLIAAGGFAGIDSMVKENSVPGYLMVMILLGFMFYIIAATEISNSYKKHLLKLIKKESIEKQTDS